MAVEFRRLPEVDPAELIALMNDPRVKRHMPLSVEVFGPEECAAFVEKKEAMWREQGYGPWAFYVDGRFAGWGGLQPENGEPDLGLVLTPEFWGKGRMIFEAVVSNAFGAMGFDSITVLLPPSRTRLKGLFRLGFVEDGEVEVSGERFFRYRLHRRLSGPKK